MKSLYLRIYATVVAVLLLFAFVSGWLFQRHIEQERVRVESAANDRLAAWAELIQRSLPGADATPEAQAAALRDWSTRLRLPLALDSASGARIGTSESFERRTSDGAPRSFAMRLEDGRTLWVMRPGGFRQLNREGRLDRDMRIGRDARADRDAREPRVDRGPGADGGSSPDRGSNPDRDARPDSGAPSDAGAPADTRGGDVERAGADGRPEGFGRPDRFGRPGMREPPGLLPMLPFVPPGWQRGVGLVVVLVMLFIAVAAGAYPVVRRLTRRLETLKRGVEQFGEGELSHRVEVTGSDEVAAVAASFNVAAARVEALVQSHQSLLANASHELRSPLARMKMAVSMLDDASPAQRDKLKQEIDQNVAELDALVEEVLLASRLDATPDLLHRERIDLLALAVEEAARVDASVDGPSVFVQGDERLLRRALRNLLENARRYGGAAIDVETSTVAGTSGGVACISVCDRGPGVPVAMRERIFEPFFRLPGHAEQAGGVGLGLSLVKQIVERHGGRVRCEGREGGGSCFVIEIASA